MGTTMCTPVYVKFDAVEALFLSEGVCRQLGIITYHPDVWVAENAKQTRHHKKRTQPNGRDSTATTSPEPCKKSEEAAVKSAHQLNYLSLLLYLT
jgi:hypothetical protein